MSETALALSAITVTLVVVHLGMLLARRRGVADRGEPAGRWRVRRLLLARPAVPDVTGAGDLPPPLAPPDARTYAPYDPPAGGPGALRVLSFNVLADSYVHPEFFPLSDPALLAPGARDAAVVALVARLADELELGAIALSEAEPHLLDPLARALPAFDLRWCPKTDRPDGCITGVRTPWRIVDEQRLAYADGAPASGHIAHVLTVQGPANGPHAAECVAIANTHLRYDEPGLLDEDHLGVRQVDELIVALAAAPVAVIAADLNDLPDGPVRTCLEAAGYHSTHDDRPTSRFAGGEARALDVVLARGRVARAIGTGVSSQAPLPGPGCPSDHVPVVAQLG